jgi:translation initiation factor IF-3
LWLDLVQIRYQRVWEKRVATAKVIDYGKFLFDQKKKDKQKKLSQKSSNKWIKEIKLWYSTTMNDVLVKVAKLKELILDWYSIKLVMRLKWRERNFKTLAIEKMSHIMDLLSDIAKPQFPEVKIDKYGMYQILIHR